MRRVSLLLASSLLVACGGGGGGSGSSADADLTEIGSLGEELPVVQDQDFNRDEHFLGLFAAYESTGQWALLEFEGEVARVPGGTLGEVENDASVVRA